MTAAAPLDWIQQIDTSLIDLEEKPQFGLPGPFDLSLIEKELQHLFDRSDLKLHQQSKGWVAYNQLWQALDAELLTLPIVWSPLQAPSFFVTSLQTLKDLMSELFGSEEQAAFFYAPSHAQGFYHYFATEVLHALVKQQFGSPLTPHIGSDGQKLQQTIGDESCFVIDLSVQIKGKNFWGKILLTESFRREWRTYFAHRGPPELSETMRQKIMVDLSLEVAYTQLQIKEWKQVKKGDFVILDHCSYDPDEHRGGVILTLEQKPVFRGRLKKDGIKLTDYPSYEEVNETMEEEPFEDEELEDLYEEEEETEEEFGELEESEPSEEEEKIQTEQAPSDAAAISVEQLPIRLTVEVGRLRMSAQELVSLAPGNLLDLNVSPEQGVDLVVNGKKVGRGELIRMGDVLGVRILSL